jgi:hypothetical protein
MIAERAYGFMLALYPRDFRRDYGDEMRMLFREARPESQAGRNTFSLG